MGVNELDQLIRLTLEDPTVLGFQIRGEDLIELDGDGPLMKAVQRRPHHALPTRADLFQQPVQLEGGARMEVVQLDRYRHGHESVGNEEICCRALAWERL